MTSLVLANYYCGAMISTVCYGNHIFSWHRQFENVNLWQMNFWHALFCGWWFLIWWEFKIVYFNSINLNQGLTILSNKHLEAGEMAHGTCCVCRRLMFCSQHLLQVAHTCLLLKIQQIWSLLLASMWTCRHISHKYEHTHRHII